MTRNEALEYAICLVASSDSSTFIKNEVISQLKRCIRTIAKRKWNEENIFAACDRFYAKHGRILMTDFDKNGLPPHTSIKQTFQMTAKEFRDKYYPFPPGVSTRSVLATKSAEEWTQLFVDEYKRLQPKSQQDFNKRRNRAVPSWITIAHMNGCQNWGRLLVLTGLKRSPDMPYHITATSHSQEALNKLLSEKQKK